MENWKDIVGYEGYYQVSDKGNVRSLDRIINGHFYKGILLKQRKDKDGYLTVVLAKNKVCKWLKVHRLVAISFIPNTENLPTVNHKNEDKTCNAVWNLEWMSVADNNKYGTRNKRIGKAHKNRPHNYMKGEKNYFYGKRFAGADNVTSKKVEQYTLDGIFVKEYNCTREAGESVGVTSGMIGMCCRGKRKTAAGFIWKYKKGSY